MNRQIVLSPLTLVLAVGLVLAALVIAVLTTVMLAGGGDASIPAQAGLPSATSTAPAAAAVASPSIRPAEVTASEEVPPKPTPAPTEPILPTPTPVAIVVQATAVQPTPAPTEVPACVARVMAASYPDGLVGTVTVINEVTGKSTTFSDRGYRMWVAGACAAKQGTCAARVIGYVDYPGGPVDRTTTVVSELTGEVSSYIATGATNYLPGACVGG
ncbi:MAG: hypothetical protein M5U18_02360 [Dehalococcoidia bacterium]|nr:hypothetical protein [Dehalococcoidia bacterium]